MSWLGELLECSEGCIDMTCVDLGCPKRAMNRVYRHGVLI